jgi:hypothetical protein
MPDLKFKKTRRSLTPAVQVGLVVLPISLQLGSFVPLYFLAQALARLLNIPPNAPVRDQPRGLLWGVLFLAGMWLLQIVGVLLGVSLNGLILRFGHGCSWAEIGETGACPRALAYRLARPTKSWKVGWAYGAAMDPL